MDGKIRVSDLQGFNYGRSQDDLEAVASSLVDYTEREERFTRNSSLLYPVDDSVTRKGLLHDSVVHLYASESDMRNLCVELCEENIERFIRNCLNGKNSSEELRERARRIEEIGSAKDIMNTEVNGGSFEDYARKVAANYNEIDSADVEKEVNLQSSELTGRADLIVDGNIVEVKTGKRPGRHDLYQTAAYWDMHGDSEADAIVDYPVIGERKVMGREDRGFEIPEPQDLIPEIRSDTEDMKKAIREFRDLVEDDEDIQVAAEEVARKVVEDEI